MPAIPEFLLRKLFVQGSLKSVETGFSFELNNTFAPVTLLGLELGADLAPCSLDGITICIPGQEPMPASAISEEHALVLPVNLVVAVTVAHPAPKEKLTVRVDTREAGVLQFTIPLSGKGWDAAALVNVLRKILRPVRTSIQSMRIRRDPQHPRLHFAPPANWMNDPNGLIYWQGKYHLFYQHNPDRAAWGNIHWGHAVSTDMLHWRHLPLALSPDAHGPDAGGCFSGCAVVRDGAVKLLYTAVFPETQCLAESRSPDLRRWKKRPLPVIPAPPAGLQLEGFRDPLVWQEAQEWRMLIGSGISGAGGAVLLYRSMDLLEWEYRGILFQGDAQLRSPIWTGTMWECPSFFRLEDKWVLIVSACAAQGALHTLYYVGQLRDQCFIPDGPARLLDHGAGGSFYAPQTFLDSQGRRIMLGWLREARTLAEQERAGWSGVMSFPRVLTLGKDGMLCSTPLPEIQGLRRRRWKLEEMAGKALQTRSFEMVLKISSNAQSWSGVVLGVGDENQSVRIGYDPARQVMDVDCSRAGGLASEIPHGQPVAGGIMLHVFVDASVLEVFFQDQSPVSARFYLNPPQDLRIHPVGDAQVELWELEA